MSTIREQLEEELRALEIMDRLHGTYYADTSPDYYPASKRVLSAFPLRNAQLAAVLELHKPEPNSCSALHPTPLCSCGAEHPCPTVRAIEDTKPSKG